MEPENIQAAPTQSTSIWNKVTPLSKYLAITLFVILPFLGGWVGYRTASTDVVGLHPEAVSDRETSVSIATTSAEADSSQFGDDTQSTKYKYPIYEIRTVLLPWGEAEALFGIDASGVGHHMGFVTVFSQPTNGWTYYAFHVPDTDAGQSLAFAYSSTTGSVNPLKVAPRYQDTLTIERERIAPDGLKFASIYHRDVVEGDDPHSLYLVDLASDSVRIIKTLPAHETFIKGSDDFGGGPMGNVSWTDNSTIKVEVYDATKEIVDSTDVTGRKEHTYLRTEIIKI